MAIRLFCPVGGTGGGPTAEHFPDMLWRYFLNSPDRPIRRVLIIATPSRLAGDKISMPKLINNYEALGIRCGVSFEIVDEERLEESDIDEQSDALCITCGNSAAALSYWQRIGLDQKIKRWYEAGIPITGYSAGFILFFDWASTDSAPGPDGCTYGIMPCMGVISGGAVPHIDTQPMRIRDDLVALKSMPEGAKALALPEDCMAVFKNDELQDIVSCNNLAKPAWIAAEGEVPISCRFFGK